jgi:hypothetical protein
MHQSEKEVNVEKALTFVISDVHSGTLFLVSPHSEPSTSTFCFSRRTISQPEAQVHLKEALPLKFRWIFREK